MSSGTGPDVPAAACSTLRPVLEGPARGARVLGAWSGAAYLLLDTPVPDAPRVVGLCLADAVHLPLSLVLAPHSGDAAWLGTAGCRATVGAGQVRVHGHTSGTPPRAAVRAVRYWAPARARPTGTVRPAALAAAVRVVVGLGRRGKPPPPVCTGTQRLVAALRSGDLAAACDAADSVLGLGPGLTPAGDDALAGVLLMARRLGAAPPGTSPPGTSALGWTVLDGLAHHLTLTARRRTTALSAELLALAGAGLAAAPVVALVDALAEASGRPEDGDMRLRAATEALLRVGHTSGADTTYGILTAAGSSAAGAACIPRRDPPHRQKEHQ